MVHFSTPTDQSSEDADNGMVPTWKRRISELEEENENLCTSQQNKR